MQKSNRTFLTLRNIGAFRGPAAPFARVNNHDMYVAQPICHQCTSCPCATVARREATCVVTGVVLVMVIVILFFLCLSFSGAALGEPENGSRDGALVTSYVSCVDRNDDQSLPALSTFLGLRVSGLSEYCSRRGRSVRIANMDSATAGVCLARRCLSIVFRFVCKFRKTQCSTIGLGELQAALASGLCWKVHCGTVETGWTVVRASW